MKFVLEVDLSAVAGASEEEFARVLRYWAGNMKHYELVDGSSESVSRSSCSPVGNWRFEASHD